MISTGRFPPPCTSKSLLAAALSFPRHKSRLGFVFPHHLLQLLPSTPPFSKPASFDKPTTRIAVFLPSTPGEVAGWESPVWLV
ncbi:hypothetical protein FF1_011607 [Malus domestica]